MFHYVKDKEFLGQSYRICADLVNQLVQNLKHYGIDAKMEIVGSKKRGLITQNEKGPIDYDFNLIIRNANDFREKDLKPMVQKAFDEVLAANSYKNCNDSQSVLTTKPITLPKGNKTPFSIDVAIVKEDDQGYWNRLIHKKTGYVQMDEWYWNRVPKSKNLWKKEEFLKPNHWLEVRKAYLDKKNMYLQRNDNDHPSFVCYIEAVNEVYYQKLGPEQRYEEMMREIAQSYLDQL